MGEAGRRRGAERDGIDVPGVVQVAKPKGDLPAEPACTVVTPARFARRFALGFHPKGVARRSGKDRRILRTIGFDRPRFDRRSPVGLREGQAKLVGDEVDERFQPVVNLNRSGLVGEGRQAVQCADGQPQVEGRGATRSEGCRYGHLFCPAARIQRSDREDARQSVERSRGHVEVRRTGRHRASRRNPLIRPNSSIGGDRIRRSDSASRPRVAAACSTSVNTFCTLVWLVRSANPPGTSCSARSQSDSLNAQLCVAAEDGSEHDGLHREGGRLHRHDCFLERPAERYVRLLRLSMEHTEERPFLSEMSIVFSDVRPE
jgi:hypothetical protein